MAGPLAELPGVAGDARRRATALTVAVMGLLLVVKLSYGAAPVGAGEVPWVVALFVLPLLYVFSGPRRRLARYRWQVLAVQAALTWVPFAIFGAQWVFGLGGLLAGLVLLLVPGRVSWPAAGLLLAADVAVRATVTGLVFSPAWLGAVWAVVAFTDDGLFFFGMVRLAQIVGEVEQARAQAASLAVAGERLQAARSLQAAVGQRLAAIASMAAAAQQALSRDTSRARAQIAAAGVAAREAAGRARAVPADRSGQSMPGPAAATAGGAAIGARLASAVLVATLLAYTIWGVSIAVVYHYSLWLGSLLVASYVLSVALQLRHSWAARQGRRSRAWPVTLGLQAVLAYVFFLPALAGFMDLSPFLAGSVLLLAPRRWRWTGYAAVVAGWSVLYAMVPLHGVPAAERGGLWTLYQGADFALAGLAVYGLSRLAGLAAQLEELHTGLARAAVVRERLRIARDVHDLLGLGLSAIALKADLAGALIGRDDARAAAEIGELGRICAAARADARLVTAGGQRLSLAAELAAARQILTSAGIEVQADVPAGPLPPVADDVLGTVLREAVTNVLRHATAAACTIEARARDGAVRLRVSNDG